MTMVISTSSQGVKLSVGGGGMKVMLVECALKALVPE
jgi:hypothetical protein